MTHFSNIQPVCNFSVKLPNNTIIHVPFIGSVQLSPTLVLHKVYYVPNFHINLVSVSALTQQLHCQVIFHHNSFLVQDHRTSQMIGKGELVDGLYVFKLPSSPCSYPSPIGCDTTKVSSICSFFHNNTCDFVNNVNIHTWHARLGHLSNAHLGLLCNKLSIFMNKMYTVPCSICPLA